LPLRTHSVHPDRDEVSADWNRLSEGVMMTEDQAALRRALVAELRELIHTLRHKRHGRKKLFWIESRTIKVITILQLRELVPDLLEVFQDGDVPGWNSVIALSELGAEEVIPDLVALLDTTKEYDGAPIAGFAAECLEYCPTVPVMAALVARLCDKEQTVTTPVETLANALAFERPSREAEPFWQAILRDTPHPEIRELAEEAIEELASPILPPPHSSQHPSAVEHYADPVIMAELMSGDFWLVNPQRLEVSIDRIGLKVFGLLGDAAGIEELVVTTAADFHPGEGSGDEWCEDFARYPVFPALQRLTINYCALTNRGLQALLGAPHLARALEELNLESNAIDVEGAQLLLQDDCLPKLKFVQLFRNRVDHAFIRIKLGARYRIE